MAKEPPNSREEVRIDAEIGDDPAELDAIADAVVRGCSIRYARVKSLRGLIDAVQRHKDARLAPPAEERGDLWKPPLSNAPDALTHLAIYAGEIDDEGIYEALDARITLTLSVAFAGDAWFERTHFGGDARFEAARFAGDAWFEGARFAGDARFGDARFGRDSWFKGVSFGGDAWFEGTRFGRDAQFGGARFSRDAQFGGACFGGYAGFRGACFGRDGRFGGARFGGDARFGGVRFSGDARFKGASFVGHAGFGRARIGGAAEFWGASFGEDAGFGGARFDGAAEFWGASFVRDAGFDGASFAGDAGFDDASFGGDVQFGGTVLAGRVSGDLRPLFLRSAMFADAAAQLLRRRARAAARDARRNNAAAALVWRARFGRAADRLSKSHRTRWLVQLSKWIVFDRPRATWRWLRYEFGWRIVRALGQLQILNRISVIAIIAVPILAALTGALQAQFPQWPTLGHSLALAYFAAVFVTLGLLLYQVFSPDSIRKHDKHDEDEFVELQHRRYPEGAEDRNDGLRRAIEHLEEIANHSYRFDEGISGDAYSAPNRRRNAGRPDRHPNLVLHHGDTIWLPPRDRIDWFKDLKPTLSRAFEKMEQDAEGIPEPGHTIVPGAERARIAIEEGAKAEYWLKSREKLSMAWASFVCYLIGLGCLLAIVCLQANTVRKAAGWWPATSVPSIKAEANIEGQTPGAALDEQD